MTQEMRIVAISVLAGLVAAGAVWYAFDLAGRLSLTLLARKKTHKLKAEAEALLEQAEEPETDEETP